jgi:hypothetical protein
VLKPLSEALDILQGEGVKKRPGSSRLSPEHINLGAGYLLPTLKVLIMNMQTLLDSGLVYCKPVAEQIIKSVKRRLVQIERESLRKIQNTFSVFQFPINFSSFNCLWICICGCFEAFNSNISGFPSLSIFFQISG